jgi:hypothetical protein
MDATEGFWPCMLPEMRVLIRREMDDVTAQMLRFTCKSEAALIKPVPLFELFWTATRHGWLDICKWIYDVAKDWKGEEEEPFVYRTLLLYDEAIAQGHYHVAEWALHANLPVRESCMHHLLINNRFEAVQWAVAHRIAITDIHIPAEVQSLPLLRWLVEERKLLPGEWTILAAFQCLPHSEEKLKYFLSLPTNRVPIIRLMHVAVRSGRWDCVDFIKTHFPDGFNASCALNPMLMRLCDQRPRVPWRHTLHLATGLIDSEYEDDSD